MPHELTLLTTVAAALSVALVLGFAAERLRLPALVGYMLAGVVIGPATPGFVGNVPLASQLAEIGVMLLMFGVGLHFSISDLLAVRRTALPGALVQMGLATALGIAVSRWWGWNFGEGLVLGLALACASTVVLIKALESRGLLTSRNGRIATGWLVVQDLVMVVVMVVLPPLAGVLGGKESAGGDSRPIGLTLGLTLVEVGAFIAVMLLVGRRVLPWMLWQVARTGSRELFTLATAVSAIGIAVGAASLFGVSFALGAFFAGMVLRESEFSHRAAEESLPLRDAFAVLFFVSVGMLFRPDILWEQPLRVLTVLAIVVLGNAMAAIGLLLSFRYPLSTALTVAASLTHIGEFSFIVAGLGTSLGLLRPEGTSLVMAGALISIAVNPVVFAVVEPARQWLLRRSRRARRLDARPEPFADLPATTERSRLDGHVVLVGYGRVGRRIAEVLARHQIPTVVVEQNREPVQALRRQGILAVVGDGTDPSALQGARIGEASLLVVATPDPVQGRLAAKTARELNPQIEVVLRTHDDEESELLKRENLGTVFFGEEELAKGMTSHILSRLPGEARASHDHGPRSDHEHRTGET